MKERILNYLLENKSITSWIAINELGCTRLSEYIRQLRKDYNIVSEWEYSENRYGEKVKFVNYILEGEK